MVKRICSSFFRAQEGRSLSASVLFRDWLSLYAFRILSHVCILSLSNFLQIWTMKLSAVAFFLTFGSSCLLLASEFWQLHPPDFWALIEKVSMRCLCVCIPGVPYSSWRAHTCVAYCVLKYFWLADTHFDMSCFSSLHAFFSCQLHWNC